MIIRVWTQSLLLAASVLAAQSVLAQTILRWGDVVGGSHPQVQMIERIAAEVKTRTDGRVHIQGFPGGQLGGSREMIEAVSNGSQQLITEGAANFGAWAPSISVVEAPYIWRDPQHQIAALNGPLLAQYNAQLIQRRGMRILGAVYYGTRHITTSNRTIRTLADLQGLKLRVPENDVFRAMAESWGARPTPMNFNELYLALSQGVVDGQENPLPTIKAGKLNEVQKYLVLSGHIMTPRLVVIHEASWQKIAAADREAIAAVMQTHMQWANEQIMAQEQALIDEFRAAGMTVIEPDVAALRAATLASVPPKFEAQWGKDAYQRIADLK